MAKLSTRIWSDTYTVDMDEAQAAEGVLFNGETTQYQTASFGHDIHDALRKMLEQAVIDGGGDVDESEEEINSAVKRAEYIKEED